MLPSNIYLQNVDLQAHLKKYHKWTKSKTRVLLGPRKEIQLIFKIKIEYLNEELIKHQIGPAVKVESIDWRLALDIIGEIV